MGKDADAGLCNSQQSGCSAGPARRDELKRVLGRSLPGMA